MARLRTAMAAVGRALDRAQLVFGSRMADALRLAHHPLEECLSVPGSIVGITPLVQQIVMQLVVHGINKPTIESAGILPAT
ncbi:hypothetical protein XM38_028980 [Halomicronema hongdechloris C2206]|uniref:Uncharacterized protein n=1 Tax=Halomicronema hongdechloris C2206 TaxID=1641165 RepID=A0A1Z3HNR1_9CYAN|nr:hypothetical protein [Halomicronema hongdechloris]ASC71944.1 hypothetical protein XM38_028980 [Halomicronema hongdechloris C2206]